MPLKNFILAIALLTQTVAVNANPDKLKSEIEVINKKVETLYTSENVSSLLDLYSDEMTFSPEYQPAIFEKQQLSTFFTSWFKNSDIKSYKKEIHEVQTISNLILEIGTLNTNFTSTSTSSQEFKGKYLILWTRDSKGSLRIKSESIGAIQWIEPGNVPYAGVRAEKRDLTAKPNVSDKLLTEVEEFDAVVIKAVAEGDSEARAKGFTEDGICMPPFGPLNVGMKEIEEHMHKTYNPGISFIVKHNYFRIYDLGDYVFINGHYAGTWGDSTNGGKFEGNMANLMKRSRDGKLLMYRQLANREF